MTRLLAGLVPSSQVATVRFLVGITACVAFYVLRRERPQLGQWRSLMWRGLFGAVAVLSYFFAIERLGAARATVLNYSSPIYAAFFASWFLGETSSAMQRVGLVVATIGAALVTMSTGSELNPFVPDVGAIAGVISAIAGGAAMTVMRKLRRDTDAITVFFAFCVVGALVSAPLAAPSWVPLAGTTLGICIAVGVLSIGGQLLLTWGMGFTSATLGSATTQLVPVVAWVLALSLLHEPVTALGVVGALVCVSGVLLGVVPWRAVLSPAAPKAL